MLGAVGMPRTVHQAKFSMGATLGLIATHRSANLSQFAGVLSDEIALSFIDRVSMALDPEVDSAYPQRWIGKVSVRTTDGRKLSARVDEPKGDPGNTLSRDEINAKFRALALSSGAAASGEFPGLLDRLWSIADSTRIGQIMNPKSGHGPQPRSG